MSQRELFVRYLLEYAMIFPGIIAFLLPVWHFLRIDKRVVVIISGLLGLMIMFSGTLISLYADVSTGYILLPALVIPMLVSMFVIELRHSQVMFAFCNAAMLCMWASVFTLYVMSPVEQSQPYAPFRIVTSAVCLATAALVLLLFRNILAVKFPAMFLTPELWFLWRFAWLYPLAIGAFLFWIIPYEINYVMIGRIRQISIAVWSIMLLIIYIFYQFLWYFTGRLTREHYLNEEKRVLNAEKIRFSQMDSHVRELRRLRHDLRQHLRVLSTLLYEERHDDMKRYLQKYAETVQPSYSVYCANYAVDAIVAYYQEDAEKKHVKIEWNIMLPPYLPVDETELCVIIGNLLENAIRASEKLEPQDRLIEVSIKMVGDNMIGIETRNHYSGTIRFTPDGMPVSTGGSGIGILSVSNTVKKNNGHFSLEVDEEWFCVDIIINLVDTDLKPLGEEQSGEDEREDAGG